jgi:hypothetical protein
MAFWPDLRDDLWKDIRLAAIAVIADVAIFSLILMGLAVFYLGTLALRAMGYDAGRLATFDTLHYYAYLVVFAMGLLDLILKMFTRLRKTAKEIYEPSED